MRNFGDLNKLIDFGRKHGVSVEINYWENDDSLSITIDSAVESKCYSQKRIIDIDTFISSWEDRLIRCFYED